MQSAIWPKLTQLLLNVNKLAYLPPYVFINQNIADFYFSNNQISVLPGFIGKIKKLRQL
jgi:Leucine-rich repeat (LRR) protein